MIVVDVNILAYFLMPCEYTALAQDVFIKDSEWAVPVLWLSEFRNILAGYIRCRGMQVHVALEAILRAEKIFRGREYAVPNKEVMDMVLKSPCSAYDCEYVALAKALNISLITADKQLIKCFPDVAIALHNYIKS